MVFPIIKSLMLSISLLEIINAAVVHKALQPQQLVDNFMARLPGGAVAISVVSPSETEYFFGGQLSLDNPVLPNAQTIFEVGSITKGFTALLLADQVLLGNVFLNDTLSKLLTDWPGRFASKVGNVTLLELTTHTAGFSNDPLFNPDSYVVYTKKELYAWLDVVEPCHRGEFNYSNSGVAILGHALALSAGKNYEEFLKERVLIPLGLDDATITLNNEQKLRFAPGHGVDGNIVKNSPFEIMEPAGALKFSVSEMVKFLQFATGIKERTIHMKEALKMATRLWGNTTFGNATIGFCWFRDKMPEGYPQVFNTGSTIGYNAYVGWIPELQIGVVATLSMDQTPDSLVPKLGLEILKLYI